MNISLFFFPSKKSFWRLESELFDSKKKLNKTQESSNGKDEVSGRRKESKRREIVSKTAEVIRFICMIQLL